MVERGWTQFCLRKKEAGKQNQEILAQHCVTCHTFNHTCKHGSVIVWYGWIESDCNEQKHVEQRNATHDKETKTHKKRGNERTNECTCEMMGVAVVLFSTMGEDDIVLVE